MKAKSMTLALATAAMFAAGPLAAQTPSKGESSRATPATPATPRAGSESPTTPATPATPSANADASAAFTRLDTNKDGVIDRSEAGSMSGLGDVFQKSDANSDSKLDRTEFSKAMSEMKK